MVQNWLVKKINWKLWDSSVFTLTKKKDIEHEKVNYGFYLKQDYIFNRQVYQFVTAIVVHKQQNDTTLMSIHFPHSL